jgi:hypothetical protein
MPAAKIRKFTNGYKILVGKPKTKTWPKLLLKENTEVDLNTV